MWFRISLMRILNQPCEKKKITNFKTLFPHWIQSWSHLKKKYRARAGAGGAGVYILQNTMVLGKKNKTEGVGEKN